jgi:hypothetical protein
MVVDGAELSAWVAVGVGAVRVVEYVVTGIVSRRTGQNGSTAFCRQAPEVTAFLAATSRKMDRTVELLSELNGRIASLTR